jgi:hypothetical protein
MAGRRVVGAFIELDRLFRKPLFERLREFNIRTLLNHFDAFRCAISGMREILAKAKVPTSNLGLPSQPPSPSPAQFPDPTFRA